jgi:putative salt-induced outer membrane protein
MTRFTCCAISTLLGTSALTLMLGTPAFADAVPEDGAWTGQGQGGLLISSGNTNATSLNAKLDLSETSGPWKSILFLSGLYGKSNGIASADRIEGRYERDRKINHRVFWFGSVDGNRDLFSGFAYQATLSTGVGYKFIDTANTHLSGLLGLGYQRLQAQQLVQDAAGAVTQRIKSPSEGDLVGVASANLEQILTGTTKLLDKLNVSSGSRNTAVANDLGVQVSISDKLALSIGYGVRYNTKPPIAVKKLDQVTTVNIVYTIK